MTPLAIFGMGAPELLIILAVVLLLFGGSRLAGLGKSTGRALKEFKEETKGISGKDAPAGEGAQATAPPASAPQVLPPPANPGPPPVQPQATNTQFGNPQFGNPQATNPPAGDLRKDA